MQDHFSQCLYNCFLLVFSNQFLFRKGTLLLDNSLAMVAALLLSLGERASSFEMLIIGRLIIGVNSGKCFFF